MQTDATEHQALRGFSNEIRLVVYVTSAVNQINVDKLASL